MVSVQGLPSTNGKHQAFWNFFVGFPPTALTVGGAWKGQWETKKKEDEKKEEEEAELGGSGRGNGLFAEVYIHLQ